MNRRLTFTLAGFLLIACTASWAAGDDGAALYKKKCAACHGANGEGKPAMKAPAFKGSTMDVNQLVQHITKGESTSKPPHNKGISGLDEAQAKAIAEYVKGLQ
jgi:mono/diheme cytochrome c family protein